MRKPTIIGIHGFNNKPKPKVVSASWIKAIEEGLEKNVGGKGSNSYDFELVYWADLRNKAPLDPEPLEQRFKRYRKKGPFPTYKDGWLDFVKRIGKQTGGNILDGISKVFGRDVVSDKAFRDLVYPDLVQYYEDEGFRTELRDRFKEAIHQVDGPLIVIGHCMGSIIAYDSLCTSLKQVDVLITIGSPLGLPYVLQQILEEFGKATVPPYVKKWYNFADKRDRIALDTHLRDNFTENESGVAILDDLVMNLFEGDTHKSYGYLRTPELSQVLAEELTRKK